MSNSAQIIRGTNDIKPSPDKPTALKEGDIIIIRRDFFGFLTLSQDTDIIVEPKPTRIEINPREILLMEGKIWFWTTDMDSGNTFKIRTDDDGHTIEITGVASGSVSVEKEKDTNDKTVTIGPVLDGQVRVFGPGIPSTDVGTGWMAILKDEDFNQKEAGPDLMKAKREFERIEKTPQRLTFRELKIRQWPYLILESIPSRLE
jgi:hypothetical protein